MGKYPIKKYITKDEFTRLNREGHFYTGFVIGMGYAYEEIIPVHMLPQDMRYNNFMLSGISMQRICYAPEAYVRSLNITPEQIKKAISTSNGDGTYDVEMGLFNRKITIGDLLELKVDICEVADIMRVVVEVGDEKYDIPLTEFNERYGESFKGICGYLNNLNAVIGIGAESFKQKWFNDQRFRKKLSEDISHSFRNNGYKVKTSTIRDEYISKGIKGTTRTINRLGWGFTIGTILINHEVKVSDVYAVAVGLVSSVPGVGWMIGGTFLAADFLSYLVSGKTIGDHLDIMCNNPVLWNFGPPQKMPTLENIYDVPGVPKEWEYKMQEFIVPRDNTRVVNAYLPR